MHWATRDPPLSWNPCGKLSLFLGREKPQRKNNPRGRKNADELGLLNANAKGNNVGKQGEKNRNKNGQKNKDHQPRNKDGNVHQNKEKTKKKVSVESKTDA